MLLANRCKYLSNIHSCAVCVLFFTLIIRYVFIKSHGNLMRMVHLHIAKSFIHSLECGDVAEQFNAWLQFILNNESHKLCALICISICHESVPSAVQFVAMQNFRVHKTNKSWIKAFAWNYFHDICKFLESIKFYSNYNRN